MVLHPPFRKTTGMNEPFKFYPNFLEAIETLPEEERANACYEFCKYGVTGELPEDKYIKMFCLGVKASVQKYQGRGGSRDGAGAPKGNKNAQKQQDTENNQNNQNNHNIQNNQKQQTETETKTETKTKAETLNHYGEFKNVCLEESYYNKLIQQFGLDKTTYGIEKLDTWLDEPKQAKKRNNNHRGYFKKDSWVWERYEEQRPQRKKFMVQYDMAEVNREITPEEVMIPAAYVGVE